VGNYKHLSLATAIAIMLGGCATLPVKMSWSEGEAFDDFSKLDAQKQAEVLGSLADKLKNGDETTKCKALYVLGKAGSGAETTVPDILNAFQKKKATCKTNAAYALIKIGSAAVSGLIGATANKYPDVRANAAWALGEIGTVSTATVPSLVVLLRDKDPYVRYYAAEALGKIKGPVVPDLMYALGDNNPEVCKSVIRALVAIGSPAVPELLKILKGRGSAAKTNAAFVLVDIQVNDSVPAIAEAFDALDDEGKLAALISLIKAGVNVERYLPVIVKGLERNGFFSMMLEKALERGGTAAVPLFAELAKSRSPKIRSTAVWGLGALAPMEKGTETVLLAALADENAQVRGMAVLVLGYPRGDSQKYIPALLKTMEDKDYLIRKRSADALAKIGAPAIPAIFQLVRDESRTSHFSAIGKDAWLPPGQKVSKVELVSKMGAPAVPLLIEGLKDKDQAVRDLSSRALAAIGSSAKAAVPVLVEIVKSGNHRDKVNAAEALKEIGPGAVQAVPVLVGLLLNNEPNVKETAIEALGKIGLAARMAVPELKESLNGRPWVRINSALALWRISRSTEGMSVLFSGLQSGDLWIRDLSLQKLGEIGPLAAEGTVPYIRKLLSENNQQLKRAALQVLRKMGDGGKAAVPELIGVLKTNNLDTDVRDIATEILGSFGPAATDAVPVLAEALNSKFANYQEPAGTTLAAIGLPAVPALIEALKSGNSGTRASAAKALGKIGPAAKEAMPALISLLKSKDSRYFQQPLRDVLNTIDPAVKPTDGVGNN